MPIDPERVKLESELFDLDQQLGSIDYSTHFSSSEKVLRKGYLQYQRRKKCLQLTILQEKAMIERLEQDLEVARTNYAQTRTPEGMRARLKREMRQQRGMALRGGVYKRPSAFERLTPEERVIKRSGRRVKGEQNMSCWPHKMATEKNRQLRELETTDPKWKIFIGTRKDEVQRVNVAQLPSQPSAVQVITWDKSKSLS